MSAILPREYMEEWYGYDGDHLHTEFLDHDAALRADRDRLLALIREWARQRERVGAVTMTYDLPLLAEAAKVKP